MSVQPSRSVGRKIVWVIMTTLLVLIFIAILISLLGGGFLGYTELNRSFNNLQTQIDANEQNLASLKSLVNTEFDANPPREQQQDIKTLQADTTALESSQTDLAMDFEAQMQRLDALEEAMATAVSNAETAETVYSEGLLTLQNDLNQSNNELDNLGGEVDALQSELTTTNTALGNLETAYAENAITPEELQYTIALFRTWEMIARARLRLLENNFGFAETDAEQALRMIDYLIENNEGAHPDNLRIIQTRLALALSNLPDEPEQASTDLETAWNEIDKLLIMATFPEEDTAVFLSSLSTTEPISGTIGTEETEEAEEAEEDN